MTTYISPDVGQSPHHWYGPKILPETGFNIQIAIHNGMEPGGLLWRWDDHKPWSSLKSSTSWGAEKLKWPKIWSIGKCHTNKNNDMSFRGLHLKVKYFSQIVKLEEILMNLR